MLKGNSIQPLIKYLFDGIKGVWILFEFRCHLHSVEYTSFHGFIPLQITKRCVNGLKIPTLLIVEEIIYIVNSHKEYILNMWVQTVEQFRSICREKYSRGDHLGIKRNIFWKLELNPYQDFLGEFRKRGFPLSAPFTSTQP